MKRQLISTSRLAEICGVSQGTVDRALNNRKGINPQTKARILEKAREYGYRPNIHARSIAGGRSMLIGVIVFDLNNQYFSDILIHIESQCSKIGYSTVVMFSNKDPQKEIECIKNMYHMSLDGIIICPINQGKEFENFLTSLDIPTVTIGNELTNFPYAGIDNSLSMREAVEYVIQKGYKKLIYVSPKITENNCSAQIKRLDAFTRVCKETNTLFSVTDISNAEENENLNNGNAFICPTDIYAIKLYKTARKNHMGIIGFDNIHLIGELGLKLDSIYYDAENAAFLAVNNIIDGSLIDKTIDHKIIKRGSV